MQDLQQNGRGMPTNPKHLSQSLTQGVRVLLVVHRVHRVHPSFSRFITTIFACLFTEGKRLYMFRRHQWTGICDCRNSSRSATLASELTALSHS